MTNEYEFGNDNEIDFLNLPEAERNLLKAYRILQKQYPDEPMILCNPNTYAGYNLFTGKRIRVIHEEVDND